MSDHSTNPFTGYESVWVVNSTNRDYPNGIYSSRELAERWITFRRHESNVLTRYPTDIGTYDWAIAQNLLRKLRLGDTSFIQTFSSAVQEHYHYSNGQLDDHSNLLPLPVDIPSRPIGSRYIWVFLGNGRRYGFPSGIFYERANEEAWIARWSLGGMLAWYPLDCDLEAAVQGGTLSSYYSTTELEMPTFVEHFLYEGGQPRTCGTPGEIV